jgi:hypothetical protein
VNQVCRRQCWRTSGTGQNSPFVLAHKFRRKRNKVSETQKTKIIREVLQRYTGPVEEFEFVKATLSRMTLEELEQYAAIKNGIVAAAEADERILRLQAARAADRAWHEYEMSQAREPQRQAEEKAQLERDRRTFQDAAKALRTFAVTEANFSVVRQTFGSSFSISQIQQLLTVNPEILSGPTPEEVQQWNQEAQEQRQQFLRNADIVTLRRLVREDREQKQQQVKQAQLDATQASAKQRHDLHGYVSLTPESRHRGNVIDAQYIKTVDVQALRELVRIYGDFQLNNILRYGTAQGA